MEIKKPEEIQKQIDKLKEELEISKKHYQYSLVCTDAWSDDMIGFFNLGNARKILTLLKEGRKLQFRHSVFGDFNVYMNPNGNRILVYNVDDSPIETYRHNGFKNTDTVIVYKSPVNEDTIMSYILWYSGEWYIDNTKK